MINFCPRCGSKSIENNGNTSEYGVLFIVDDTGSSLEYASSCSVFACNDCGKETIIECQNEDFDEFDF